MSNNQDERKGMEEAENLEDFFAEDPKLSELLKKYIPDSLDDTEKKADTVLETEINNGEKAVDKSDEKLMSALDSAFSAPAPEAAGKYTDFVKEYVLDDDGDDNRFAGLKSIPLEDDNSEDAVDVETPEQTEDAAPSGENGQDMHIEDDNSEDAVDAKTPEQTEDAAPSGENGQDMHIEDDTPLEEDPDFSVSDSDDDFINEELELPFEFDDDFVENPYEDEKTRKGLFERLSERRAQRAERAEKKKKHVFGNALASRRHEDDDSDISDLMLPEDENTEVPVRDVSDETVPSTVLSENSDNSENEQNDFTESSENSDKEDKADEAKDASDDPTDIDLMVAFGLDDEQHEKAKEAKEYGNALAEKRKREQKEKKFKLERPEFVDRSQVKGLREEYKKKNLSLWIRLLISFVATVVLFVFENIKPSPESSAVFNPYVYPVVYAMISLQIMLITSLCIYDYLINGIKNLFKGTPRPETVTALMTVVAIIYSAVIGNVVENGDIPVMFNAIVALASFLTLVYAIYNQKREMMNFRIVANRKPKHIIRRLDDEESRGEVEALDTNTEECDVMKIEKTDFIDGFYARLDKPDKTTSSFTSFVLSASVALAVLIGIFAAIKGESAAVVWRTVYVSLLAFTPLSLFITFSYPFFRANKIAKDYESTIIGDVSLEEYSNASVISFDDKNIFPSYSVKVQNIRIYNNARIDRVLYYAASVFAYAGGPLQDVFEVATKDIGNSGDVKIFDAETGFLATQVDGVNIIFGSNDALTARGLEIPQSAAEDDVDFSDELSVMYMFRENKLVAKMYIKYVMDPDIDLILKQFSGEGLYVCIHTFDPNIDEHMIASKLNMGKIPLKIIRYADAEEVDNYEEKAESGLVTSGSPKFLLQIISFCGKVLRSRKTNIALGVLSGVIGIAIIALLLISGSLNILNSLLLGIYQLVWIIPAVISSRIHVR